MQETFEQITAGLTEKIITMEDQVHEQQERLATIDENALPTVAQLKTTIRAVQTTHETLKNSLSKVRKVTEIGRAHV